MSPRAQLVCEISHSQIVLQPTDRIHELIQSRPLALIPAVAKLMYTAVLIVL